MKIWWACFFVFSWDRAVAGRSFTMVGVNSDREMKFVNVFVIDAIDGEVIGGKSNNNNRKE